MVEQSVLEKKIKTLAPDVVVKIYDYTGTQDHYEAEIISSVFNGKNRISRHRMVMDVLGEELKSGALHALTLKAYTPEEHQKVGV